MSDATIVMDAPEVRTTPGPNPPESGSSGRAKFGSIREAIESKANMDGVKRPTPKPSEKPSQLPAEKPVDTPAKAAEQPAAKPNEPVKPVEITASNKQETWKTLKNDVKTFRSRAEQAEAKLADYEKQRVPDQERSTLTQRMDAIQAENKRLRDQVRFKDYENSPDFLDKFHKPYESRLGQALKELGEIPVTDPVTGENRYANQSDLFELINLNPVERLELAKKKFGELAGEALGHAKDVRKALLERNQALEDEKKNGEQRETQTKEQFDARVREFTKQVTQWASEADAEWAKDSDAAKFEAIKREDGKELTPEETEHNAIVERGEKLTKEWIGKHPKDAKTPEEAREIVRHQKAILKRAARFGVVRHLWRKEQKLRMTAEKELSAIRGTTPVAGGRQPVTTNGHGESTIGSIRANRRQSLSKYIVKPG